MQQDADPSCQQTQTLSSIRHPRIHSRLPSLSSREFLHPLLVADMPQQVPPCALQHRWCKYRCQFHQGNQLRLEVPLHLRYLLRMVRPIYMGPQSKQAYRTRRLRRLLQARCLQLLDDLQQCAMLFAHAHRQMAFDQHGNQLHSSHQMGLSAT